MAAHLSLCLGPWCQRLACIMIYEWWPLWILCSHWRYPPFCFLYQLYVSLQQESNSSSYSLISCSYPCPDWLAYFIKQKIREREMNEDLASRSRMTCYILIFKYTIYWAATIYLNVEQDMLYFLLFLLIKTIQGKDYTLRLLTVQFGPKLENVYIVSKRQNQNLILKTSSALPQLLFSHYSIVVRKVLLESKSIMTTWRVF